MRNTRRLTRKASVIGLLILLTFIGCATPGQTIRGQEGKGRYAGFASTTKTQYVTNNQYVVDAELDPNQPHDPNAVLDVRIIGNNQIGAKDIIKIIKTKKDRPFSEATLEEDKRALMQKGWFIDVKPKVEKTPSGYIVTFQFIERPILHYVKIVGNKVHTRKILLEEANIKPGDALDPIAVHQAAERLEQFYHESGYFRVHIEILSGDQIGDRGAVFLISEGQKQRILDVDFEGNTIASSSRLKTLIQSKPGWFFWINSEFTRKKLDEDLETLTTYYRKLGFFYAKVDRKFVETEGYTNLGQNRNWVKVKFVIDEGPRCRVRDIRFIGQRVYDAEFLRKTMKLPKEKFFNQDMLEVDMQRIKEEYGKLGYVFAKAEPDPRIDDDYVDLVINVKEGPRCYLNTLQVEIVGNEGADPYTKWHPILNRMSLHPGDILSTKEINASKRRLMASQLFNSNPTQGQTPDIIFSYPEEAIEDEEKAAAAMAEGTPKIRGQAPAKQRSVLFDQKPNREEEMGRFSEFFRLRSPEPVDAPEAVPVASPQYQKPYQPTERPVEPMKLGWKDAGSESLRLNRHDDVYRGQATFSSPRVASPAPISMASYTAPVATNTYVPPTSQVVQAAYPQTVYQDNHSGSLASPIRQVQYQQPANIQLPATSYAPTAYTPTSGQTSAGSASGGNYATNYYLSPTSTGQQVGSGVLYNQGPVFTQQPSPVDTNLVLGNSPVDNAIGNSAYAMNPNDPYGKVYPTDAKIIVQETRTGQLMMSVAVSSDSGLMGRFVIEEQNFDILNLPKGWRLRDWKNAFRGKGQRFRIEAVPGTEVQRYAVSWETPYLFNLDYSFGVNGSYYERFYDEWYEQRVGGGISFGKLWTPDFSTVLRLGGQQVKIYRPIYPTPDDLTKALGHHPMYTVGLEANHNTRDSEFMPTEGHLISVGVEQVLGDFRFVRGSVDLRKYFTLHERPDRSGRWVLGLRSSLGVSEKKAPIYERYYGGGFTNLRGFEFRGVSPRDSNGIIIGGCMEFYNSAELVFPITADDMIRGSVFIDTGTVERSISNWDSNYRVALGFGLRLTIPMMGPAPIALDFAFPVSKDKYDEKQIFSFNVGFMR